MSKRYIVLLVAVAAIALAGSGCGEVRQQSLRGGEMVMTTANYRAINQTPAGDSPVVGRVKPAYITCAEPSPDVAKAVSTALDIGASGSVTLPSGVSPEIALAISRARAEALVQLTERLATTQLLRDGLHSACEAYANGAISDTTYAVMLSRFDKTMVTMLLGELAAGAFGRPLAAAGAGSEGTASAAADLADKMAKTKNAEAGLQAAKNRQAEVDAKAQEAKGDPAKAPAVEQEQAQAKEGTDTAQKDVTDSLKAETASAAKVATLTAAGAITPTAHADVANTLAEIQRKYIENLNFDALEVACVSALDRAGETIRVRGVAASGTTAEPPGGLTPLAAYCLSGILPEIQKQKGELLRAIINRAEALKDADAQRAKTRAEMKAGLKEIEEYVAAAKALIEQVKSLKAVEFK